MKRINFIISVSFALILGVNAQETLNNQMLLVKTANGELEGVQGTGAVKIFKGIPYAQPPVGELRWKEPVPLKPWTGVRKADHFGPRAMQRLIWNDMVFRSEKSSENCLYLNVWTPALSSSEKLPVLVYFHGGGLVAGDGSEYRYDGESMAKKGIVVVTVNYRLGVFGFMAHPELTRESAHHSSGNYGLLDQHAALVWVKNNIAAFGGNPDKITIGGESAGSMSVSAQMASPLSKGLFIGGIAESGSMLGTHSTVPLAEAEQAGITFAQAIKAATLSDLRKVPADSLLQWSASFRFPTTVDGYFLPQSPTEIYSTGKQMDIPLLSGWNSAEVDFHSLLGKESPTVSNYKNALKKLYGDRANEVLKLYAATTDEEVEKVATDLASDRFICYSTWKFIDLHGKTNGKPVYRYLFSRKRPSFADGKPNSDNPFGAVHASEIEYALGNLSLNKFYAWTTGDFKVSETMSAYFANFIKTGDPNGQGLPVWYGLQSSIPKVMQIDVTCQSSPEKNLQRYVLLDSFKY